MRARRFETIRSSCSTQRVETLHYRVIRACFVSAAVSTRGRLHLHAPHDSQRYGLRPARLRPRVAVSVTVIAALFPQWYEHHRDGYIATACCRALLTAVDMP